MSHRVKSPIFLSAPSIICSAGNNSNVLSNLLSKQRFLTKSSHFGKTAYLGIVREALLEKIPLKVPISYQTRTNLLTYNALLAMQEAIEQIKSRYKAQKIGVVIGTTTSGIGENYKAFVKLAQTGVFDETLYYKDRISFVHCADFVREFLGLEGISFSISTACTSGSKAIMEGARLLKSGICDAVICGGSESLNELTFRGFDSLEILSRGVSNPFCAHRDGINLGEGAGLCILSREALECGSVLLSAFVSNNDAYHITAPNLDAQQQIQLISQLLKQADLREVDYINLHATGTKENDRMEARAVSLTAKSTPCSGQKGQIGHTLAASGAIGVGLCALLILQKSRELLPQVYSGELDGGLEKICFANGFLSAPISTAISLSFAFGGDNAGILLQRV